MEEIYESTHYVCSECGGVSGDSGVCNTENCSRAGDSLLECNCSDGEHSEILNDPELHPEYESDE